MSAPAKPSLSVALSLVKKWGEETGHNPEVIDAEMSDGSHVPAVSLAHGQLKVLVRDHGIAVLVSCVIPFPDDSKKQLSGLTPDERQKALFLLRAELMSNHRSGFQFVPRDVTDFGDVQGFTVDQIVRVAEDDPSCFNRLNDAVQEVVTVAFRAITVLGILIQAGGGKQAPAYTSTSPPPSEGYG